MLEICEIVRTADSPTSRTQIGLAVLKLNKLLSKSSVEVGLHELIQRVKSIAVQQETLMKHSQHLFPFQRRHQRKHSYCSAQNSQTNLNLNPITLSTVSSLIEKAQTKRSAKPEIQVSIEAPQPRESQPFNNSLWLKHDSPCESIPGPARPPRTPQHRRFRSACQWSDLFPNLAS